MTNQDQNKQIIADEIISIVDSYVASLAAIERATFALNMLQGEHQSIHIDAANTLAKHFYPDLYNSIERDGSRDLNYKVVKFAEKLKQEQQQEPVAPEGRITGQHVEGKVVEAENLEQECFAMKYKTPSYSSEPGWWFEPGERACLRSTELNKDLYNHLMKQGAAAIEMIKSQTFKGTNV